MNVSQEAWDYTNELAMRGIAFGCALKAIKAAVESGDDALDKIEDIRSSLRVCGKDLDEFIHEHYDKR